MNKPLFPLRLPVLGLAVLGLGSAPAPAETVAQLDDIVVTATRTARSADEALASVTVISRREIEASQARSVDELLRGKAGVDIGRNGGYGKSTSVYLRGTNSGHVLVLVDGVRAGSATLGSFAWENLSPDQVERIEIVRGPRAALYGSDAVGGVIQIFTRRVRGMFAQAGLGSQGSREASAGIGGNLGGDDGTWRYSVSAGHFRTDGTPTNTAFRQDHGHENNHLAASLSGPLLPGLRLTLDLSHAEGNSELDPNTGNEDFRNQVASLRLDHRASASWSQRLLLGHALDDYTTHSLFAPSSIRTRRTSLAWQHDLRLFPDGLTTVGLDAWRDQVDKDASGTIHRDLDTSALYLQQQWRLAGADWLLGLRRDQHDVYGDKTTGSLAWGMDVGPATRLHASYGTAFKAPAVNDLFWPFNRSEFGGFAFITEGNPELRPERSRSLELGLRQGLGGGFAFTANLYRTRVKDLIEWVASQTAADEFTYRPANLSKADIDGLELGLGGVLDGWRLDAQVDLLAAENAATGVQLDRRPERKLSLRLGRALGAGDWQAEVIAASARNDRNGTVRLAGYGLLNLAYRRPLGRDLEFSARLENALDQEYVLASSFAGDYNTLGRSLYLSLRYQNR